MEVRSIRAATVQYYTHGATRENSIPKTTMFTKKTLMGLKIFFLIHNLVKAGPFFWKRNGNDAPVRIHTGKVQWVTITAVVAWMCIRMAYAMFNFVSELFAGAPVTTCAINYMYFQFYIFVTFYNINMFHNMHQIMEFLNCLLHFNSQAAVKFLGKRHPVKVDGCERFIWMLLNACVNNGLLVVVSLFLPDPMNTRYYYHFLAEKEATGWLYWSWPALEYMSDVVAWSPWLLILFALWMYAKSTTFWLQQIRFGANPDFTDNPKEVIRMFQQLQILNLQFNSSFAELGMPALVMLNITGHVSCIIFALKLHGSLPPAIYFGFPAWAIGWFFIEGIMYTMLGNVSTYSRTFVKSWTEVVSVKGRKRLKSMRPLGVKTGNIYVIHRTTVLSMFLVIVNLTVQVLLLY